MNHSEDNPSEELTKLLADELKDRLHIRLFNFDLIRQNGPENTFYIVDINYFPGIDKIDNFEDIFIDFLTSACQQFKRSE